MAKTTNYGLEKPGLLDKVVVGDLNTNFDIIDTEIKKVNDKVPTLSKLSIENVLGFTIEKSVPSNAKFTDTVVDISGKADKSYVDGKVKTDVPAGALFTDTKYSHPSSHPAAMITESESRRFVSDANILGWNGKQDKLVAGSNISISEGNVISSVDGGETIEVVDNLASVSITKALSANQGKVLDDKIKLKADKTYVDMKVKTDVPLGAVFTDTPTDISGKADISYVNSRVKTEVPSGAKFTDTDTITSINGKTGVIEKADIVALGIPEKDTTYTAGANISISEGNQISATMSVDVGDLDLTDYVKKEVGKGLSTNDFTNLDVDELAKVKNKADKTYVDDKVKTDVPLDAKFTDTNTTYTEITTAEIDAGTSTTLRTITGRRVKYILDKVQGWISGLTKSDVDLGNVDNVKQASKVEFDGHNNDATRHMTSVERTKWNAVDNKVDKVSGKGLSTEDYTTTEKNKLNGIQAGAQVNTVTSVAGRTGAVTISKSDVGLSNVDNLSAASIRSGTTKADVGLSNVDNIKQMPISGGVLENYTEKLNTTTGAINLSLGNVFYRNATANTTFTITNSKAQTHSFTLIINMGAVKTISFPSSVKWQGGEIPDMSEANKTYVLTFMTIDSGTTWLGMFGGSFNVSE